MGEPVVPEQPEFLTTVQDIFITVLRLGTCALMVHHGFDKIQNVDGFSANVVAKFFGFLPGRLISGHTRLQPRRLLAPACLLSACSRARLRPPWPRPWSSPSSFTCLTPAPRTSRSASLRRIHTTSSSRRCTSSYL